MGLVTVSLAPLYFFRSFCGGDSSFAPWKPGRPQLSSLGLLKKRFYLYGESRPKMQFRPLSAYFIPNHSLKLVVTLTFKQNRQWLMLKNPFFILPINLSLTFRSWRLKNGHWRLKNANSTKFGVLRWHSLVASSLRTLLLLHYNLENKEWGLVTSSLAPTLFF